MKNHRRILSMLMVAFLALTPVLSLAEAQEPEKTPAQIITDNTTLDLSVYEGKGIFLNFFTKWCPYCMKELPDIKKLYETYNQDELQIILVHVWDGENEKESEEIRAEYGLEEMTFFEDEDQRLSYVVGLQGYPLSVFIGKDGSLADYRNYALSYEDMAGIMDSMGIAEKEAAK